MGSGRMQTSARRQKRHDRNGVGGRIVSSDRDSCVEFVAVADWSLSAEVCIVVLVWRPDCVV